MMKFAYVAALSTVISFASAEDIHDPSRSISLSYDSIEEIDKISFYTVDALGRPATIDLEVANIVFPDEFKTDYRCKISVVDFIVTDTMKESYGDMTNTLCRWMHAKLKTGHTTAYLISHDAENNTYRAEIFIGGKSLGVSLLSEGYALLDHRQAFDFRYTDAEAFARRKGNGVWSKDVPELEEQWILNQNSQTYN